MRTRKLSLGTRNLVGARVTQARLQHGMKQVELLAQLQLAGFLRERYFCTFYDAVKAILPAGLWFRRQETFALTPEAVDWPETESAAGQLLQFLRELGGSAPDTVLRQRFPDEAALAQAIKALKGKKMLTSSLDLMQRYA